MTFDGQRGRIVLFGGADKSGAVFGDTWEWDGTRWTLLQPTVSPTIRAAHAMTFDAIDRRVLVFGGQSFTQDDLPDTWELGHGELGHVERCVLVTEDLDGDMLAGCADPDCWGRCAPLCAPGTSCDPAAPHCGDMICSAIEDDQLCPIDCPP